MRDANVTKGRWSQAANFRFLADVNGAAAIVSSREHLRDAVCREELRENALPVLEALAASLGMVFRLTFVTGDRQGVQGEGRSVVSCAAFHQTLRERAIAGELNIRCVCPGGLLCLVKEIVVPDGRVIAVLEGAGYASGKATMRNCELLDGMAGEWRQAPDQLEIVTPTRMRNAERLIAFTASSIGTTAASGDAGFSVRTDDPLSRAREFLRKNFREKLQREQVAAHVGVHADHLTRLFRESGAGFTDYLNAIRVRHAEQILLDTSARISEIAFACGFDSIPHFNREFLKRTGLSPSLYRRDAGLRR